MGALAVSTHISSRAASRTARNGAIALVLASFATHANEDHTSYLRLDNDILAERDQGYSNGAELGLVSPTVATFEDERLSGVERWLSRKLRALQPRAYNENNVVLSISQQIYTPADGYRSDLIREDRPYAGVLLFGIGYNSRNEDSLHARTLHVGVVGPSAMAEQVQDFVHGLTATHRFSGWNNQLRDEPLVRILEQRYRRYRLPAVLQSEIRGDLIVHVGGSLGNLATFANAGAEIRVGKVLPDNFGSAPWLPTGEVAAPVRASSYTQVLTAHFFAAIDVKRVLYDITLDGNTLRDSHSVERTDWVADVGIGIAGEWRGWKVAITRYFRTREFDGQTQMPQLGSITIRKQI